MNFGINSGLSGLTVSANKLSISAHNLANINTPGFKSLSSVVQSLSQGNGAAVTNISQNTAQGSGLFTGNALDLAIQGSGFFKMLSPNGVTGYSRVGLFGVNENRQLSDAFGNLLDPPVSIPPGAESLSISNRGLISAWVGGQEQTIDLINLYKFTNPSGLTGGENGLYLPSDNSGQPTSGKPGQDGFGTISPGMIEGSNVDMTQEMVNMLQARHQFSASIKSIQTADEMLKSTLDIKA